MSETEQMTNEICRITLVMTAVLGIGSWLIFPGMVKSITLGIVIGSFTGLFGFRMIVRMSKSIVAGEGNAYNSYLNRYLIYVAVFALCIYQGVNAFALLVGMLAHKASILIYTWQHRKEDD